MTSDNLASHLSAVPEPGGGATVRGTRRQLGVIDGRLDAAARVVRFLGSTLLAAFVVGLVGALVLHATIIENQRGLDAQRTEIRAIRAETIEMRAELAQLEAPARIVVEAERMGMIEAPAVAYVMAPAGQLDDRTLAIASTQLQSNG